MGWFFLYLVLCGIHGALMASTGFGSDTWQWWVLMLCQVFSYTCGRAYENSLR